MDKQTDQGNEMAELDFLSDEELKKKIKTLEFETNSFKSDIKRFQNEQSMLLYFAILYTNTDLILYKIRKIPGKSKGE